MPAAALNHPQPPATQPRLQVVHKQPSEPLLDVRTEDGQELAGLPVSECCLQVGLRKPVSAALPAAPSLNPPLHAPQNERDDTVDDLVKSDFLHEPGWVGLPRGAC